jgi:hypothetical protein
MVVSERAPWQAFKLMRQQSTLDMAPIRVGWPTYRSSFYRLLPDIHSASQRTTCRNENNDFRMGYV